MGEDGFLQDCLRLRLTELKAILEFLPLQSQPNIQSRSFLLFTNRNYEGKMEVGYQVLLQEGKRTTNKNSRHQAETRTK